jgi:hypothetical protein
MRGTWATAFSVALVVALFGIPVNAAAQTSLDGFGSVSLSNQFTATTAGDADRFPVDLGGRVSFEFVPGVEGFGEFGRIGNVLSETVTLPLTLLGNNVRMSAFYGEGGVRLLALPRSRVSPYAEGSFGVAHLTLDVKGFNSTAGAILQTALNYVDTRDPVVGFGSGLLLRGGPVHFDLGYRYKRILADSPLSSLTSLDRGLRTHQIRFGMGVRF